MLYLEAINGPSAGKRYELSADKNIMGRHPDCDIVIDVGAVSRQHAQLLLANGQVSVEDLGSRNGTFVNGQLIQQQQALNSGDNIQICDVSYCFRDGETTETTTTLDGPQLMPVLVDDGGTQATSSTIMSKLDVSSSSGSVQLNASPEVKLNAMVEITQSLGRALALDDVLPQVLNSLFKIFLQADRGFIVLAEEGQLVPRWTKMRRENEEESCRISRTILHQVMDTKEAILSADAASDSRFEMSQSIADFRIRSMMCAPLVNNEGESIGALQIDTVDQRSRFRPEDLEVLVAVAGQAAIAIDNAKLHENALRQKELERDLDLAKSVQRGFLPSCPPEIDQYRFFEFYQAANHVGGDYYDYVNLPDGRIGVVVADVVGHGIAAALLMVKLAAETQISLFSESKPAAAISRLNTTLSNQTVGDRFVTLVLAVLNPTTHEVTIVNAGHMTPIVRRKDGRIDEPGEEEVGVPLSVADDFEYEQHTIKLEAGEMLMMYTDGINESMNDDDELYGIERLRKQIAETDDSVALLGDRIIKDVRQFSGGRPQFDDMCLVCFGRA